VRADTVPDETAVALAPYTESHSIHHHVLDGTGYTLPRGRAEVGLWYVGYGITDWLSVGTMPGPWVLGPLLGGYALNLSVKLGFAATEWLRLGLEVHPLWFRLNASEQRARALIIPITAAATVTPTPAQNYSLAVRYADVEATNEGTVAAQELRGAAVVRLVEMIAQVDWQLTRMVTLYAQGLLQLWQGDLRVRARGQTLDARTTVDLDAEASPLEHGRPWALLGGVALAWGPISVRLGAGYGSLFIPRFGMTLRKYEGFLPDINVFVRF
jgi:hypothetical protein